MSTTPSQMARRVHVRPPGRWPGLELRELWAYRELLYFLGKRELQIRYKQSILGVGWAVVQPLALTFLFALFLGRLAKVPSEGAPYPVFALAGLVAWIYVAAATAQSATSLVADSALISKVYFPRLVVPLAKILSLLTDLFVSLGALVIFMIAYGVHVPAQVVLFPVFLVLAVLSAAGVGLGLSALNVRYRDVSIVMPFLIQMWFFASPIAYPGSLITGPLQYLYAINPVVGAVDGMRWSLLDSAAPPIGVVLVSAVSAIVIFIVSVVYFRRSETFFADVI